MNEARIYQALLGRDWTTAKEVASLVNMEPHCAGDALTRLKDRGAVVRTGARQMSKWKAIPGQEVRDRRETNGRWKQSAIKQQPKVVAKPKLVPIARSPLAQALEWQP